MPRQPRPVEEVKEVSELCGCKCHDSKKVIFGKFGDKYCCNDANLWIPENEFVRIPREHYKLKFAPIGDYTISWKEIDMKGGVACDRFAPGSDAEEMMWSLARQDKVRTRVPRETKEPVNATATVQFNGLRVNILKGVSVELPEQVAEQIDLSYYQTEKALEGNHERLSGGYGSTRTDLMSEKEQNSLTE